MEHIIEVLRQLQQSREKDIEAFNRVINILVNCTLEEKPSEDIKPQVDINSVPNDRPDNIQSPASRASSTTPVVPNFDNDDDLLFSRRKAYHVNQGTYATPVKGTLKDMKTPPINSPEYKKINYLMRFSKKEQEEIAKRIYKEAEYNVRTLMGIDSSSADFVEIVEKEADRLLESFISSHEQK